MFLPQRIPLHQESELEGDRGFGDGRGLMISQLLDLDCLSNSCIQIRMDPFPSAEVATSVWLSVISIVGET